MDELTRPRFSGLGGGAAQVEAAHTDVRRVEAGGLSHPPPPHDHLGDNYPHVYDPEWPWTGEAHRRLGLAEALAVVMCGFVLAVVLLVVLR